MHYTKTAPACILFSNRFFFPFPQTKHLSFYFAFDVDFSLHPKRSASENTITSIHLENPFFLISLCVCVCIFCVYLFMWLIEMTLSISKLTASCSLNCEAIQLQHICPTSAEIPVFTLCNTKNLP